MKKLILLLTLTMMFGQNIEYEDVLYLKNGTIIHGLIIETVPGELIKIQSGRNVFVYQMSEIEKITKEIVPVKSPNNKSDISNKNNSIGIGIGTNKSFNVIQYTHDFRISKGNSIFIMLGYGNLFGLGWTYQSNYNENGLMIGWGGGTDVNGDSFGSFSGSYQWRLGNSNAFFSLGFTSFAYTVRRYNYSDYGGYYTDDIETVIMPVISIDTRF
jgi:hypothetical protein